MHHSFFIHSSVDGHLGHFHVLAIANTNTYIWNLKKQMVLMNLFESSNGDTDIENKTRDMAAGETRRRWEAWRE